MNTKKVRGVRVRSTEEFHPPEAGGIRPLRPRKISALPSKRPDKARFAEQFWLDFAPDVGVVTLNGEWPMKCGIYKDADSVAQMAAKSIAADSRAAVAARGRFVLAVSGGHT